MAYLEVIGVMTVCITGFLLEFSFNAVWGFVLILNTVSNSMVASCVDFQLSCYKCLHMPLASVVIIIVCRSLVRYLLGITIVVF